MASTPHITDQEFAESGANREAMYRDELKRSAVDPNDPGTAPQDITYMDILGRGRWPVDYITARQAGHDHAGAMQVERVRIREAAGLPATEPMPPAPGPTPGPGPIPPQPPVEEPGVVDNMQRFATFYAQECGRRNWAPDQTTTHEQQMLFLQDCVLGYRRLTGDDSFVMKRADPGRPISNEVVVFAGSATHPIDANDYRRFWDFIQGAGTSTWKIVVGGHGDKLPTDQILVDPATLQNMEG